MLEKNRVFRIFIALIGITFVGTGIAFNGHAMLGNDSVGIVYDGVRNVANLSSLQLGIASNIVNFILTIIVFITGRRYVNIGTLIYILPYGWIVNWGGKLYQFLFKAQELPYQILGVMLGCLLIYIGVALFIAADIGLDPITGIVMVIKDKTRLDFQVVKIGTDLFMILLGFILGGKLGIITIVTALIAGPCIQWFSEKFKQGLIKEQVKKEFI